VIALIALVVAVIAMNDNRSMQSQLIKAKEKADSLSANNLKLPSRADLDKVSAALAQEKLRSEELEKKLNGLLLIQKEQVTQIVHSVSKMQAKLKIAPTLETQLRQAAAISAPIPVPVKELVLSKPVAPADAKTIPLAGKAQASEVKKQGAIVKDQVKLAKPVPEKKYSPQVQSIKESIEQFNK